MVEEEDRVIRHEQHGRCRQYLYTDPEDHGDQGKCHWFYLLRLDDELYLDDENQKDDAADHSVREARELIHAVDWLSSATQEHVVSAGEAETHPDY